MSESKMHIMREGMEYQCITEDSKTRVYVSVVRKQNEEELRKELNARKRRRTKKKIIKFLSESVLPRLINVSIDFTKLLFGVATGLLTYIKLAERMRIVRGYEAIGGEVIFACIIAALAYCIADLILEGWKVE